MIIAAAMRTPLPKPPRAVKVQGRLKAVGFHDHVLRATDIMIYVEGGGPRRVYTFGRGAYFVREKNRRRVVDINEVLRVLRRTAEKELQHAHQ